MIQKLRARNWRKSWLKKQDNIAEQKKAIPVETPHIPVPRYYASPQTHITTASSNYNNSHMQSTDYTPYIVAAAMYSAASSDSGSSSSSDSSSSCDTSSSGGDF